MPHIGEMAPPLIGQPVFGLPVDLARLCASGPALVCFVRHLGSPACRATLAQLQALMPELDRRGVALVAVTPSGLSTARDFVPRNHLLFPVLCDPDAALALAWGVGPKGWTGIRAALLGLPVMPRFLGYGQGPVDGPLTQIPASFAVRRGGHLALCVYGGTVASQPPLADLLEAACSP